MAPDGSALPQPDSTAMGRIAGATWQGIVNGFGPSPLGLDDNLRRGLQRLGVIPPHNGGGTVMQNLNEAFINPFAAGVDLAGRTARAAFGAYQAGAAQTGEEIGQPQLGRDFAALPEAFAGQIGGMRLPQRSPVRELARPLREPVPGGPALQTAPPALRIPGSSVRTAGVQVQGRFPTTSQSPNAVMYRMDRNGQITNYQVWGPDGLPAYRVDVTGSPHGGMPTPHVIEFGRNVAPSGQSFTGNPGLPKPATPAELP